MEALAPSYKQGVRIYQAATETPTKTGQILQLDDQIAGFIGFRPTEVDPLRSMGFKIAEYQAGIRNSRREFTGGAFGLLRGGSIKPNDIINRFYESNKARFNVQKEMNKNINAAEILGVSNNNLKREFKDRQLSDENFNALRTGKFKSYFPSEDIRARFAEIARDLGEYDAFRTVYPTLKRMQLDMNRLSLNGLYQKNIQRTGFSEGGSATYEPTLQETDEGGIDLNDYLIEEVQPMALSQTPMQTPMPSAEIIQQAQAQASGIGPNGLTPTENALLSEEEKQIRLRSRGLA
jgi:hypothetical protein